MDAKVDLEVVLAEVVDVWCYESQFVRDAHLDVAEEWAGVLGLAKLPELLRRMESTLAVRPPDYDDAGFIGPNDDLIACTALLRGYVRKCPKETLSYLAGHMTPTILLECLEAIAEASYALGKPTIPAVESCVLYALSHPEVLECRSYAVMRVIAWNLGGENRPLLAQILEKIPDECHEARQQVKELLGK